MAGNSHIYTMLSVKTMPGVAVSFESWFKNASTMSRHSPWLKKNKIHKNTENHFKT